MGNEGALGAGTAAVEEEWGEEEARRLELYEVRAMRRAVVHEVLGGDAGSSGGRPPRVSVVLPAQSNGFAEVEHASLAQSHLIEGSYRSAADALRQVPGELADGIRATVDDWRALSAEAEGVRFRVAVEEERVAEFRVRGSRRRYWVGIRSKRVLRRSDPSVGLMGIALKVGAVLSALVVPPFLSGFLFGRTGTILGLFVSLIFFLGLVVAAGASSKSVVGVGK